jgi:hypothetical protein
MLALTEAGETLLAEAQDWFRSVLHRALDGWRPEEIGCVERFLTALEAEFVTGPAPPTNASGVAPPGEPQQEGAPVTPARREGGNDAAAVPSLGGAPAAIPAQRPDAADAAPNPVPTRHTSVQAR